MKRGIDKFDMRTKLAAWRKLAEDTQDGLKLFRLVGPDLDPEFNDQVGVARNRTVETFVTASNRSGKSLCAAAIFASIVRDEPLLTYDEKPIHCRMDKHRGSPVTAWAVGYQMRDIGQTIGRLLFEPGQFRCITDPDTGALRAWKPWLKKDADLEGLTTPAPPLIPPSLIDPKTWNYENKAAKQVLSVCLKNGSMLQFYASSGEAKKGDPVHFIWLNELIQNSAHYPEWIARLTDYEGRLLWDSILYKNCPAIPRLIEDAELQREQVERGELKPEDVITKVFQFTAAGNPYLPKARLDINRRIYEREGEDVVKQRMDGGSIFDSTLIYPFFDKYTHTAIPAREEHWDDLAKVLHRHAGQPPKDWTHELCIDPGAQKPAVLFFATPPRLWRDENGKEWSLWAGEHKPYFVPYDEIYGQRYTLRELVDLIKEKMRGVRFRRFIMDRHGGSISSMVGGSSAKVLFAEAFDRAGIESEETGSGFVFGSDQFPKRKRMVEDWFDTQPSGFPQLRIVTKRCPHLVWQLAHNTLVTLDREGVLPQDKPNPRERNDLRDALEYIASLKPTFVHVPQTTPLPSWVNRAMEWEDKVFGRQQAKSDRCHFGPGVAP